MTLDEIALLIKGADALFVDWDGCVSQNDNLLPDADRFLRRFAHKTSILSNNSTDLPDAFTAMLRAARVDIPPQRILLAGHQAVHYAATHHGDQRIFMLANKEMRDYASARGLELVGQEVDVVLLLRDLQFTYTKLRVAANMVRGGATLIAANPDLTHPTDDGVVPETGALLAAIEACLDSDHVAPTIIGKPSPLLFRSALNQAGVAPVKVVMIGDNPLTDIVGAARLDMQSVLINARAGVSLASIIDAVEALPDKNRRAQPDRHADAVAGGLQADPRGSESQNAGLVGRGAFGPKARKGK